MFCHVPPPTRVLPQLLDLLLVLPPGLFGLLLARISTYIYIYIYVYIYIYMYMYMYICI